MDRGGVSQKLNIPGAVSDERMEREEGEFQPCYFKEEGRLLLLPRRLRLVRRRRIHVTRPKSTRVVELRSGAGIPHTDWEGLLESQSSTVQ